MRYLFFLWSTSEPEYSLFLFLLISGWQLLFGVAKYIELFFKTIAFFLSNPLSAWEKPLAEL